MYTFQYSNNSICLQWKERNSTSAQALCSPHCLRFKKFLLKYALFPFIIRYRFIIPKFIYFAYISFFLFTPPPE